ncbi:MAG: hypothetical protein M3R16_04725 [Pseudomonadota bacterium]|nr:hypothetical protein [Pseudomonadota bacterium]
MVGAFGEQVVRMLNSVMPKGVASTVSSSVWFAVHSICCGLAAPRQVRARAISGAQIFNGAEVICPDAP